jgi:hypothetical protein
MGIMNAVAKGEKSLYAFDEYMAKSDTAFQKSAYRMGFTTNHDENTWNGTGGERYGVKRKLFDVLSFTLKECRWCTLHKKVAKWMRKEMRSV